MRWREMAFKSVGKQGTLDQNQAKFNYVYFNFLTCSAIFMYFEFVCVLSKYKDVDATWSKNARLDTHPITI